MESERGCKSAGCGGTPAEAGATPPDAWAAGTEATAVIRVGGTGVLCKSWCGPGCCCESQPIALAERKRVATEIGRSIPESPSALIGPDGSSVNLAHTSWEAPGPDQVLPLERLSSRVAGALPEGMEVGAVVHANAWRFAWPGLSPLGVPVLLLAAQRLGDDLCKGSCPQAPFSFSGRQLFRFKMPSRSGHDIGDPPEVSQATAETWAQIMVDFYVLEQVVFNEIRKVRADAEARCGASGSNEVGCQPTAYCECAGRLSLRMMARYSSPGMNMWANSNLEVGWKPHEQSPPYEPRSPDEYDRQKAKFVYYALSDAEHDGKKVEDLPTLPFWFTESKGRWYFLLLQWEGSCTHSCQPKKGVRVLR